MVKPALEAAHHRHSAALPYSQVIFLVALWRNMNLSSTLVLTHLNGTFSRDLTAQKLEESVHSNWSR